MNIKIRYRLLPLIATLGICNYIQGEVISLNVLPETGTDAVLGISSENAYTHAFKFGNLAPEVTGVNVNGVYLTKGWDYDNSTLNPSPATITLTDSITSNTLDVSRDLGTGFQSRAPGYGGITAKADGDAADLFGGFSHYSNTTGAYTSTFTLNGLNPGTDYSARIYGISWSGSANQRMVTFSIAGADDLVVDWNDPSGVDLTGGTAFYVEIQYTATSTSHSFTLSMSDPTRGPHLSGFTNQVIPFLTNAVYILPATGTDAVLGISSENAYTHAFKFGNLAPAVTGVNVNGVYLTKGWDYDNSTLNPSPATITLTDSITSNTLDISRDLGTGFQSRVPGYGGITAKADGDAADLFGGFSHYSNTTGAYTSTFTLNGLNPGTNYSARIYGISWSGSTNQRMVTFSIDDADDLVVDWNDPSGTDLTGGTAFYVELQYTATNTLHSFTLSMSDPTRGPHLSGVTNQVISAVPDDSIYVDAVNGSDSTGDGSSINPYETLSYVLSLCSGGETILLRDGNYGVISYYRTTDLFSDWVTIKAANGASPEIERISMDGPRGSGQIGSYDVYLRLEGIILRDGWKCYSGRKWELYNCLIERFGPWTGSVENIEKVAVDFLDTIDAVIEGCEITNTGIGISGRGHNIAVLGNYIHDGTHDGIRVTNWWNALVEGNIICRFDDGVADGEGYIWNRHCDLIHIFIPGPGDAGMENNNVLFRNNILYDSESQGVQFNNYGSTGVYNRNITFEYNVFGPTRANLFNNADRTDGLVFRNNTIAYIPEGRTLGRWTLDNHNVRVGASTGVEIYNNNLYSIEVDENAEIMLFDWNILLSEPNPLPKGVDMTHSFGRFTQVGVDYELVNAADFDGALEATSPSINAGTRLFAPVALPDTDLWGTSLDLRPDIGAWEKSGESPAAESAPTIYNDTKTVFVDDFEDGHYKDVDDWLNGVGQQGLSWYRPEGYDSFKPYVQLSGSLSRQALYSPIGATGQQRISWLISEQGSDWSEYDLSFSAHNAFLVKGSGVTVLTVDEENAYWLDISRDYGRLIRIMGGVETVLATNSSIEMPHNDSRDYLVTVRQTGSGILIEVDADDDGSVELSYLDTNSTAISTFVSGGIGIHDDNNQVYQRMIFDDFRVDVLTFAP